MNETLEELLDRGARLLASDDDARAAAGREAGRLLCLACGVPSSLHGHARAIPVRDGATLEIRAPGCLPVRKSVRKTWENGSDTARDTVDDRWSVGEAGGWTHPDLACALAHARRRHEQAEVMAEACAPDPLRTALRALVLSVLDEQEFLAGPDGDEP